MPFVAMNEFLDIILICSPKASVLCARQISYTLQCFGTAMVGWPLCQL